MSTKLEALKQYLQYVLDNKKEHNWSSASRCHCGMLLTSLNLHNEDVVCEAFLESIDREVPCTYYDGIFKLYQNAVCGTTKLRFTEVLNKLVGIGFTLDELIKLEHLEDTRFGTFKEFDLVDNLIQYLNNWINYEEQLVKATTKDSVKVTVTGL